MDNMLNKTAMNDIPRHSDNDIALGTNHSCNKLHDHVKALRDKKIPTNLVGKVA